MRSQINQPDEDLRQTYPDGVILVAWGPSGIAPKADAQAVLRDREDQNSSAARWLGELQKPDVGLAALLGCAVVADPQAEKVFTRNLAGFVTWAIIIPFWVGRKTSLPGALHGPARYP